MTLGDGIFQNKEKRKLSKYYNSYIAYDRYNTYKRKSEDAPYILILVYKIKLKVELEKITRPSSQKVIKY